MFQDQKHDFLQLAGLGAGLPTGGGHTCFSEALNAIPSV